MTSSSGQRIVGGMFGLEDGPCPGETRPPFMVGSERLFVNARSALAALVRALGPTYVWMPSYTCWTMMWALDETSARVRFFEIDYDLVASRREWLDDVQQNDLVILIDYFGFPFDEALAAAVRQKGAWVLEDASQALLSSSVGGGADFVLFSPMKFLGVPDGGILRYPGFFAGIADTILGVPPRDWWMKSFYSCVLRREFDLYGGSRHWFTLFQEVDDSGPIGDYAMSELSESLLHKCFDYQEIARKRISNFETLLELLREVAIFRDLPPGVVPVGFPIRARRRDQVRHILYDHQIYPPVHWPLKDVVPAEFEDSHRLSGDIMTLPCDQRYEIRDMRWMAQKVLQAMGD